jgi:excisionase family DNA binding protein
MTESLYISTGKAARLLGVTRDTVLKWIKMGRLSSTRTAGGHFRVPREEILALVDDGQSLSDEAEGHRPSFCWEFHSRRGEGDPACHECLVFRARALRCYEMIHLSGELGHAGAFCKASCQDCAYYHQEAGRPRRVLVVTDSVRLRQRLKTEAVSGGFDLEFAASEYECSARVESFQPELIVIDSFPQGCVCEDLSSHVATDPRISGVKVIVVGTAGNGEAGSESVFARMSPPFSLTQLEGLVGSGHRAVLRAGGLMSSGDRAGTDC